MPGSCAVAGCRNRFVRGGKHFYRFPKNEQYKTLWIQFTRKGNFQLKKSSAICQDHFAENRVIVKKKGRLYLVKQTVPTIYYRDSKDGLEKVTVEFDDEICKYVGHESINLLRGNSGVHEEKILTQHRNRRIKELKSLCRFCFECQDEKFVAISKLEAYNIDPEEMLALVGIGPQYNDVFSDIVCEQCFQQVVAIDAYRKRCRKAQMEIVIEMEELDVKLHTIKRNVDERPWFKAELITDDQIQLTPIEIIEEHLEDNIYIEEADEDYEHEEYDVHDFVSYKIDLQNDSKDFRQIIIKNESKNDSMEDSMIEHTDPSYYEHEDEDRDEEDFQGMEEPPDKDIYDITDTDIIIKNPDRNSFALRIYECFFCRLKFAGKKTYKAHECQVKEVKCEVEGCDKLFNKLSGYNTHVVKVHNLLKTSRHYCPICKNVVMSTENQFKLHCRRCVKESEKKDSDRPIECEICGKKCPNLKSYTVHKLFHDSKNLIGCERGGLGLHTKGPVICELCGKEFTNAQGLRTHKKNVHRLGQPSDVVYQCDICSKMRPTKRSLFNHMRNVHRVRETPCNVCGKVFRTPALLQKHAMYHDETKRTHRCPQCPDKPGWFTNVALKRHQKSHHLGMKDFVCDMAYCEASFTTSSMLKQHKSNYHGYQL